MSDSEAPSPWAPDNFDPRPSDAIPFTIERTAHNQKIAVIRTTDRLVFKRCRRLWGWTSHLRGNLGGRSAASPLWLGSGFHFAMEDFHGEKKYGAASNALEAYAVATFRKGGEEALPDNYKTDLELGKSILSYYEHCWLRTRDPLQTFVYKGQPQLEVNFRVEIPFDASHWGYEQVVYSGTLDRVIIDENGLLWIVEYKTAKAIVTHHFQTDPQVTAYCWAASLIYPGYKVAGVVYQQHLKTEVEEPRMLSSGKLSTTSRQQTDYQRYRQAMTRIYGKDLTVAPMAVLECLNEFAKLESIESNKFVRRDRLYRNEHQTEAEGAKIMLEVVDMLNPDLPLYPNPTRDCGWCGMQGPCTSMDDGSDWIQELDVFTKPREQSYDGWRKYLPTPKILS